MPDDPVIHHGLHLNAMEAEPDLEAKRLMDLAEQEELDQSYTDWHDAHAKMNKTRVGFWEDPVKAYEAQMYWDDESIPAAPQWDDPGPDVEP